MNQEKILQRVVKLILIFCNIMLVTACGWNKVTPENTSLSKTAIKTDIIDKTSDVERTNDINATATDNAQENYLNSSEIKILKNKTICIDPGHQKKQDLSKEEIAPNSGVYKEKMTSGTQGKVTKTRESELNLKVSLRLQEVLKKCKCNVVMTRTSEDADLGNIERAKIANDSNSDLFIRIHADGSDDSSVRGMSILYPGNKYLHNEKMLKNSRRYADVLSKSLAKTTKNGTVKLSERNDMTGFNWSKVPTILLEMGFMTNADEEKRLLTDTYQEKIVDGLLQGSVEYFN
jgi:N-acetylmuramoyl-L-alanine amidase